MTSLHRRLLPRRIGSGRMDLRHLRSSWIMGWTRRIWCVISWRWAVGTWRRWWRWAVGSWGWWAIMAHHVRRRGSIIKRRRGGIRRWRMVAVGISNVWTSRHVMIRAWRRRHAMMSRRTMRRTRRSTMMTIIGTAAAAAVFRIIWTVRTRTERTNASLCPCLTASVLFASTCFRFYFHLMLVCTRSRWGAGCLMIALVLVGTGCNLEDGTNATTVTAITRSFSSSCCSHGRRVCDVHVCCANSTNMGSRG
mmetsp:Transcript_14136/g.30330  ORF Transcript_14136/g.30330 Transcript_14136/m.30330 type:complete len:250 (-) Transcript_14136:527-1276(-)